MTSNSPRPLAGVALVSGALLMIELALTRIFSVVMYYHFAFLAISIALFGISASGVFAYVARGWLGRRATAPLLAAESLVYAVATVVSLFFVVRLRVGLQYSPRNLALMLTIYGLAAAPFFTGGLVVTTAISRFADRINVVYAADLIGAACGCLALIPLLNRLGAPGVVFAAAVLAAIAAALFADAAARARTAAAGASNVQYLRYELTALAYHLVSGDSGSGIGDSRIPNHGFTALVIGPGGGRDLVSALVFGAGRVDGIEINPIIADDVMRDRFRDYSGGIYTNPRVRIVVDDGRSFLRRSPG